MTTRKKLVNLRIDVELLKKIDKLAEERGMTFSELVRKLLEGQVKRVRKSPDEIRSEMIQDDRRRYIKELELEGLRVIDISEVIYHELKVEAPPLFPHLNYLLIMDKDRQAMWVETPPPMITKGTFELYNNGRVKTYNLYGDVFDKEDFDKGDWEIKEKLHNFIREERTSGMLDLHLQPYSQYFNVYKNLGSGYTLVKSSKYRFQIETRLVGETEEEALNRAWEKIKKMIKSQKPREYKYSPYILYIDELKDKLWIISPDSFSALKIMGFSKSDKDQFVRYLTHTWRLYFSDEPKSTTCGDMIIIKLPKYLIPMIGKAIESDVARSPDHAVFNAIREWCEKPAKQKTLVLSVSHNRPAIKKALEEGRFKSPREVVEQALDLFERKLTRY